MIADAQERLPGLRPCGFHSPYEAAAWAVLSQRLRIVQAARLRDDLVRRHGDDGAFPAPAALRTLDLDLPGRKAEYLHAVAEAALDGGSTARGSGPSSPRRPSRPCRRSRGSGRSPPSSWSSAARTPRTACRRHERRLDDEVTERYGRPVAEVAEAWRPFRTWASVHLRISAAERARTRR